jgi:hypothetical protein
VAVAMGRCKPGLVDRVIVLRVTDQGTLFLNTEEETRDNLASRLSEIYRLRMDRTIYLQAEDQVPFQKVADAIDIARSSLSEETNSPGMTVRLITPRTAEENSLCHVPIWHDPIVQQQK